MKHISVLDCTLRDGGYCNECRFEKNNIAKIVRGLTEANIDIIECGFLNQKVDYDSNVTRFSHIAQVTPFIPEDRNSRIYVVMMNYGDYNVEDLPLYDGSSVDGIRVAFHKKDCAGALNACRVIKEKGYKVFVQAMVSLSYSDEEFLALIRESNKLNPYAFYIVDSFGMMNRKQLTRLFYMVEHNLNEHIFIGFHSHNNMQLAFSNAQSLVDIHTSRSLIIDSSVYGMGRGAGNLNTELFVEYLNDTVGTNYDLKPLLVIIDDILSGFYQRSYWGYSLPNYLSAKHNTHPNYAGYLDAKKTLTVEAMDYIFNMMDDDKRFNFDKDYIETLYLRYMSQGKVQQSNYETFKDFIKDKEIVLVAPGKSSSKEKEKVVSWLKKKDVVSISVNFEYPEYSTDYIFVSNLRRFRELSTSKNAKTIVTSNIPTVDAFLQIDYKNLLNQQEFVKDNAGMMLIKFLIQLGAKKVYIAGIDGYSLDPNENFANQNMNFFTKKGIFEAMNLGMEKVLAEYSTKIEIEFITTPKFINL